jgi:hypothetical protein
VPTRVGTSVEVPTGVGTFALHGYSVRDIAACRRDRVYLTPWDNRSVWRSRFLEGAGPVGSLYPRRLTILYRVNFFADPAVRFSNKMRVMLG